MSLARRIALALPLLALACGDAAPTPAAPADADGRPTIYATAYPVAWLAERLVGDAADVVCPVPADADPIFWEPAREDLRAYRSADLVVANGAEFAKWLERASLPESRLVRSADGFADEFLHFDETTHSHGPGGEHTHAGIDGHTWMDPELFARQAGAIAAALTARFPALAADVARNRAALVADLERLLEDWRALAPRLAEVGLICSHPAYDYLWRRLGLAATNLDLDPDALLGARARAALSAALAPDRRNVLIWEAEPGSATRTALEREFGVASVTVSPVEVLPRAAREAGLDWLSIQRAQLAALAAAVE